ncbi:MAG: hypothetical protein WCR30_01950 [Clostridia bacterium]
MIIFGKRCPVLLIKIFAEKNYRDDFIKGKMYLKECGYFSKLEDTYRGDKLDSKLKIYNAKVIIEGEKFIFPEMEQGFVGDEKVPILCTTILNEIILEDIGNCEYKIKKEYKDELKKFGDYALIFYYKDLKDNLDLYAEQNNLAIDQGIVDYTDINPNQKEYLNLYRGNYLNKYFIKNITYKYQNECRFILLKNNKIKFIPLVEKDLGCYIFKMNPLKFYKKYQTNELLDGIIQFVPEQ